jgi:hypothetical protein
LKLIGRPLISAIRTPVQSSSVGFSMIAHPWRYGFAPFPSASSTSR